MIRNLYNEQTRGFTLIELLVVIAIIGVLSSVVLASLNTARGKGANSAVKSNMAGLRAQAEIFYDDPALGNATYSGLCTNTKFAAGVAAAHSASGASGAVVTTSATNQTSATTNCHAFAGSWVVSAPLRVPETVAGVTFNYWCADSNGASKGRNLLLSGGATICPTP